MNTMDRLMLAWGIFMVIILLILMVGGWVYLFVWLASNGHTLWSAACLLVPLVAAVSWRLSDQF